MLLAEAFEVLPPSAQLHWFTAQFVRQHKPNRHIEHLHLLAAEVRGVYVSLLNGACFVCFVRLYPCCGCLA